jgi:hypothetical protein
MDALGNLLLHCSTEHIPVLEADKRDKIVWNDFGHALHGPKGARHKDVASKKRA